MDEAPTRLLRALTCGDRDAALEALREGDDVNARDERPVLGDGITALHLASSSGDAILVRELIQRGAEIDATTGFGQTPLWLACNAGHFDAMLALLEQGADPTITNRDGYSPGDRIPESERQMIEFLKHWVERDE